jgi:hypothetical protein
MRGEFTVEIDTVLRMVGPFSPGQLWDIYATASYFAAAHPLPRVRASATIAGQRVLDELETTTEGAALSGIQRMRELLDAGEDAKVAAISAGVIALARLGRDRAVRDLAEAQVNLDEAEDALEDALTHADPDATARARADMERAGG